MAQALRSRTRRARTRAIREQLRPYTTRLQKGGALLREMRRLLMEWDDAPDCAERMVRANVVSAPSRNRAWDVVFRAFIPRFVNSAPPNLWKPVRELELGGWPQEALLPIHYYAAAAAEPLLWDFAVTVLPDKHARGQQEVRIADVMRFLAQTPAARFEGRRWTREVSTRVGRGLLAALRDLGVLTGGTKKRLVPLYLPVESFAFISRIRYELGLRGQVALRDPCWRLFHLGETAVERLFLEAHQRKLLSYLAAGSVIRIDFPDGTLEDYARELASRAH